VNKAVAEADRITQENIVSAEKSASVSEELNMQVNQMKRLVSELTDLLGGRNIGGNIRDKAGGEMRDAGSDIYRSRADRRQPPANSHVPHGNGKPVVSTKKNRYSSQAEVKEVSSEQLIPFDNDDFQDF